MAALTSDRMVPSREGARFNYPVAGSSRIFAGSLVSLDASGNVRAAASTNTSDTVCGIAEEGIDNSDGNAGDKEVRIRTGVFRFANKSQTGNVTRSHIGKDLAVHDDNTVSYYSSGQRLEAGVCVDVEDAGVWVRVGI